jgi:hypothetical protein
VHVTEVFVPPFRVDNGEVDVEVPVWLLGLFDHVDELLDGVLELFSVGRTAAVR